MYVFDEVSEHVVIPSVFSLQPALVRNVDKQNISRCVFWILVHRYLSRFLQLSVLLLDECVLDDLIILYLVGHEPVVEVKDFLHELQVEQRHIWTYIENF
jgi:hypothetical protein